jgi:hypothetical protein
MSISGMTNVAIARRDDDLGKVDGRRRTPAEVGRATADSEATQSGATSALKAIVTYIPTEVLTLYVAALAALAPSHPSIAAEKSALPETGGAIASSAALVAFWIFLVLTPLIVWLVYAAKVRNAGKRIPTKPKTWPWWEMVYALPDSVFTRFSWYTAALGTLAILVVSTLLGLVAPLVHRTLRT